MKRQFRYKYFLLGLILLITFFVYIECQSLDDYNEFLEEQNLFLLRERNRITKAQWSHDSNITNFNEINLVGVKSSILIREFKNFFNKIL